MLIIERKRVKFFQRLMKVDEMDGMDSLSTTSDHSVASSPPSPQYNSKAVSPSNHINNDKQFSIRSC